MIYTEKRTRKNKFLNFIYEVVKLTFQKKKKVRPLGIISHFNLFNEGNRGIPCSTCTQRHLFFMKGIHQYYDEKKSLEVGLLIVSFKAIKQKMAPCILDNK